MVWQVDNFALAEQSDKLWTSLALTTKTTHSPRRQISGLIEIRWCREKCFIPQYNECLID